MKGRSTGPGATYRVQLSRAFDFDAAAAAVPYLAALGVTTLYTSPILQAASGGHGYDVVDPTRLAAELGGEAAFRRLVSALHGHGMGLLVDIVPNHMATAGRANPWWWDVLCHGPSSRYAGYFDVDWRPAGATFSGKVLLGVLGDRYGRELESGALRLERVHGEPVVRYHDQEFPVASESLDGVALDRLGGDPDALDSLLRRQHYRLAYWRSAQEELNYRRFFTIDSLIGLRVERAEVFKESHGLLLGMVERKEVDGLRVDHVDGLRDPLNYLNRLRAAAPDAYVVVEKILGTSERLAASWPVEGTTGYEFVAHVDGLFVDHAGEQALTATYHALTGESQPYAEVVRSGKREILAGELSSDVERLTTLLVEICDGHRAHRDRTHRELRDAIAELATAFPVYRTYAQPGSPAGEADVRHVDAAVQEAVRRRPDVDPDLARFVGEVVLLRHEGDAEREFSARFQQLTPAAMAKGVEDTAFYRYHRLVSLNEVGGDPSLFGRSVESFHEHCAHVAADRPLTMNTLSTHDTKRSADVRARIGLLSEIPADWESAVRHWMELNERHRVQGFPDRNAEYLLYQTLIGTWRIEAARLEEFLVKAAREASVHTSWMDPKPGYEEALLQFARGALEDMDFVRDLETFLGRHEIVGRGRINSLAAAALLLTAPGVPDIYQGSEVWDLSLVDPDNRRPVDFAAHERLLARVHDAEAAEVMSRADQGAPKLWLVARLLNARREDPGLFASRSYTAIVARGAKAAHVVSFAREKLLVLVPRLVIGLAGDWADTTVDLPPGRWRSLLTDAEHGGGTTPVGGLVQDFPVAVLRQDS